MKTYLHVKTKENLKLINSGEESIVIMQPNRLKLTTDEKDSYFNEKIMIESFLPEELILKYPDETIDNEDIIHNYVGHLDRFYAHYLSGPDGGFPMYWKCNNCKSITYISDK